MPRPRRKNRRRRGGRRVKARRGPPAVPAAVIREILASKPRNVLVPPPVPPRIIRELQVRRRASVPAATRRQMPVTTRKPRPRKRTPKRKRRRSRFGKIRHGISRAAKSVFRSKFVRAQARRALKSDFAKNIGRQLLAQAKAKAQQKLLGIFL